MTEVIERLPEWKARLTEQREKQGFERSGLWVETEVRRSKFVGQEPAAPMALERRRRAMITADVVTEIEGIVEEFKRNLMKLAAISRVARTSAPFADWYAELPDAMTVSEFARRFSWTEKSVRNMIDRGELGCHQRAGCSIRILKPQVLAWVEASCGSLDDGDDAIMGRPEESLTAG